MKQVYKIKRFLKNNFSNPNVEKISVFTGDIFDKYCTHVVLYTNKNCTFEQLQELENQKDEIKNNIVNHLNSINDPIKLMRISAIKSVPNIYICIKN